MQIGPELTAAITLAPVRVDVNPVVDFVSNIMRLSGKQDIPHVITIKIANEEFQIHRTKNQLLIETK